MDIENQAGILTKWVKETNTHLAKKHNIYEEKLANILSDYEDYKTEYLKNNSELLKFAKMIANNKAGHVDSAQLLNMVNDWKNEADRIIKNEATIS